MKNKKLQAIALFMACLIISLPLYSAQVFASINAIEARGSDGALNAVKKTDYINFIAEIESSGNSTIDSSNVWLGENFAFNSCAKESNTSNKYLCVLRHPASGVSSFNPRLTPYTVNLKDNYGAIIESKSSAFVVDEKAPEIMSFNPMPVNSQNKQLEIKYSVFDKACSDVSCNGKCSGIKSFEIKTKGNYSANYSVGSNSCILNSSFSVDASSFSEGENEVSVRVFDNVNQASEYVKKKFIVDNTPPVIIADSFRIMNSNRRVMNQISSTIMPLIFQIKIAGTDIDTNNVFADFSSLGFANLSKAKCSQKANFSECEWNLKFGLSQSETKKFKIKASDIAKNSVEEELSYNFEVDKTSPVVKSIKSAKEKDGKYYAKGNAPNAFSVEFEETGAGMDPSQVLLHLGSKVSKAVECTEGWTCYWNASLVGPVDFKASIGPDTKDMALNPSNSMSVDIKVDSSAPKLLSIEVNNTGSTTAAVPGYFKTGDSLVITAIIEEKFFERAYADFSEILESSNSSIQSAECENIENNNWKCIWITDPIDKPGFIESANLKFYFEDFVENVLEHKEPVTVYGLLEGESDNWETVVECSPKLIDRETTSLINQKLFCHVKLKQKSSEEVVPLSTELIDCDTKSALSDIGIFNNQAESLDPYINLVLKKTNFKVNELDIKCQLNIFSKVGNLITQSPEVEEVTLPLRFYNMPLGELSSSVKDKMTSAVDEAKGLWEYISMLNKVKFYAEKACQLLMVGKQIIAIWNNVTEIYKTATKATAAVPPAAATMNAKREASCFKTEMWAKKDNKDEEMWDKACKFVNCDMNYDTEGKYTKYLGKWQEYWKGDDKKGGGVLGKMGGDFAEKWTGEKVGDYMDPHKSIIVAIMFACVPGIIAGLEKYRQIKCMYASCLYDGVAKEGLPVVACEDQKSYATCKYITGEIFNVFPFTALFDKYMNQIKDLLSNPFKILGAALAALCAYLCPEPEGTGYNLCRTTKLISMIGQAVGDVTSIIDGGFEIKGDYCENLDEIESFINEENSADSEPFDSEPSQTQAENPTQPQNETR